MNVKPVSHPPVAPLVDVKPPTKPATQDADHDGDKASLAPRAPLAAGQGRVVDRDA